MSEIKLMELLKGSPEISARIFVPKSRRAAVHFVL